MALRDKLTLMLKLGDTPHRLSLAFAVGVFIGMSPLLGVHTVLGILVAYIFRLNKLATVIGVYITNPWTIIPIYTFSIFIGAKCLGIESIIPSIDWKSVSFSSLLNEFSPILMPFVVGTIIVGAVSSVVSYFVIYRMLKRKNA